MAQETDPKTTEGFTLVEFQQNHLLIYYYGNAGLLVIGLFFTFAFQPLLICCKFKSQWLEETRTVSDDFYKECSFEFLTKELSRTREELVNILSRGNRSE